MLTHEFTRPGRLDCGTMDRIDAILTRLETAIPEWMSAAEIPGLSLALVDEGACVWAGGFGVRNAHAGGPVSEHTVFELGSLSKPIFAALVLRLWERGAIQLDAPVSSYLAEDIIPANLLARLTVRHVLSHSSGLPNWRPPGQPLAFEAEPGEAFSYSGEAYHYLQRAVEKICGKRLDEYAEQEIFRPLGMDQTSFIWRASAVAASGHDSRREPLPKWRPDLPNAANTLHTSAVDYARFLVALLRPKAGQPPLLTDASVTLMLRPTTQINESLSWGLGWGLQETPARRSFWHGGVRPGFRAFVLAVPDRGTGLVLLSNSDQGHRIVEHVLSAAIGGPYPIHKRAFHSHL